MKRMIRTLRAHTSVVRTGLVIGATTGFYGVAFGAIAAAAGASVTQAAALSALCFTGGSQFAAVGVLGGGGAAGAAWSAAWLLGLRNGFYGLRIAPLVHRHGWPRRLLAAQLTIDESAAVAIIQGEDREAAEIGFWVTGSAVFVCWFAGTVAGAAGASSLGSPATYGLDAAAPAAFIAFVAPQLRAPGARPVLLASIAVCLVAIPLTRPGIPVVVAVLPAAVWALVERLRARDTMKVRS